MKRIAILFLGAILTLSCKEVQDSRFFAPELEFSAATYSVTEVPDGVDVKLTLSRPAATAFSARLVFSGTLQEGLQYTVPSHSIDVPAGATEASVHITLIDDEIWEPGYISITLAPGSRYTVNPSGNCEARVEVTKHVVIPVLRLSVPEAEQTVNPYCAAPVTLTLTADKAPLSDITVPLSSEGFVAGEDFLLDGQADANLTLAAGATSAMAMLQVLKKDQSGYDKQLTLGMTAQKGVYGVSSEGSSVSIRLHDPVVDFKPLWKTAAQNGGTGYRFRQAIKTKEGEWAAPSNNNSVDLFVSSEGSNYLRNFRNMFQHSSFNCLANATVSQMFCMSELFPNYIYPNDITILDYGNDQGHREFSPTDSLMRFVLDPEEQSKGKICLEKPRTFVAFIGPRASWSNSDWPADSRATGGDIFASTNPVLQGKISVTLHKLEGSFDFSKSDEPIVVTAWFTSDSDMFLKADEVNGKDPATTYGAVQEEGMWKLNFKIWPY